MYRVELTETLRDMKSYSPLSALVLTDSMSIPGCWRKSLKRGAQKKDNKVKLHWKVIHLFPSHLTPETNNMALSVFLNTGPGKWLYSWSLQIMCKNVQKVSLWIFYLSTDKTSTIVLTVLVLSTYWLTGELIFMLLFSILLLWQVSIILTFSTLKLYMKPGGLCHKCRVNVESRRAGPFFAIHCIATLLIFFCLYSDVLLMKLLI